MTSSGSSSNDRHSRIGRRAAYASLAAILCAGVAGCSESGTRSSSAASNRTLTGHAPAKTLHHAAPGGYLVSDGDSDVDDNGNMRAALTPSIHDTFVPPTSGGEARGADRRAIVALIKSYYASAAAGAGGRACPMLSSAMVETLAEGSGTSAQGRERACAAAATSFFRQQHHSLAADHVTTMVVADVRIRGDVATAVVGFTNAPVGLLRLKREAGAWRLVSLLDTNPGT